jgi:hypothetical protein
MGDGQADIVGYGNPGVLVALANDFPKHPRAKQGVQECVHDNSSAGQMTCRFRAGEVAPVQRRMRPQGWPDRTVRNSGVALAAARGLERKLASFVSQL